MCVRGALLLMIYFKSKSCTLYWWCYTVAPNDNFEFRVNHFDVHHHSIKVYKDENIQFNWKLCFHNNIYIKIKIWPKKKKKNTVQQKDKKVMEEKVGRPKGSIIVSPFQSLIMNKNKFVKKQTNKRDNYETRQGSVLQKRLITIWN